MPSAIIKIFLVNGDPTRLRTAKLSNRTGKPEIWGITADRGSQQLSIRYTEHKAEEGIESSVGSVGDSYDNALAETIIGLYKTEVIRHRGPWRHIDGVRVFHPLCAHPRYAK